jgi:hypothetical protein
MTKKERKPKEKKKKNNSDYESRHRKRDNSPTKLAARRVVAANCQLQPHMELSWKEGRKNLGERKRKGGRGGRSERREEEMRGAQESRKTAAANSGDGRTDDGC